MLRVGLTGNVASGKSTVAEVWRQLGAPIVDADALAREAVESGSDGLRRVIEHFGTEVLRPDGGLDRPALRARVFSQPSERAALEAILHPEIQRLRVQAEARLMSEGARIVVHVIPLLFEVGLERAVDRIVLVDSPESVRSRRLVDSRGLSEEEARRIIAAQAPAADKRGGADIVIENDSTIAALEQRATAAWREIEGWTE